MRNNINIPDDSLILSQIKGEANWFFWIAGFSIINVICIFLYHDFSFMVGLGLTSKFAVIAQTHHNSFGFITVVMIVVMFAMFILFGYYGRKFKQWAFIAGTIIYFADGVFLALGRDWFGIGFHALALIYIVISLMLLQKHHKRVINGGEH
jgi:hypothetical protein